MTHKIQIKDFYIASDHAGFELKEYLKNHFTKKGVRVFDLGCDSSKNSVDYPDYANAIAKHIDDKNFGILICGSGIGISIAANRHKHCRAALCLNKNMAKLARAHNDANLLCLGARLITKRYALTICKTFFFQKFEGQRHVARVSKLGL